MDGLANLNDRWVHFKLRDVYVPPPGEVLDALHGNDILQGRVVGVTAGATAGEAYAVVRVEGFERPVVVPLARILGVV